jgi:hypothetical protein
MDLSTGGLMASLVIGAVGMGVFLYGKRQERYPQLIGGVALMVYPYFVGGQTLTWVIGGVIIAAITAAVQAGY